MLNKIDADNLKIQDRDGNNLLMLVCKQKKLYALEAILEKIKAFNIASDIFSATNNQKENAIELAFKAKPKIAKQMIALLRQHFPLEVSTYETAHPPKQRARKKQKLN
jgi:uncharacterized protein (UPF0128 family)